MVTRILAMAGHSPRTAVAPVADPDAAEFAALRALVVLDDATRTRVLAWANARWSA
jgi:hypothetical protein